MRRDKMTARQYAGVHTRKPGSLLSAKVGTTAAGAGGAGISNGSDKFAAA